MSTVIKSKQVGGKDRNNEKYYIDRPRRAVRLKKNLRENINSSKSPAPMEKVKSMRTDSISKEIIRGKVSPVKTPIKAADTLLVNTRPKRILKLPSKLEGHALDLKISPVKPIHCSTPIVTKSTEARAKVKRTKRLGTMEKNTPEVSNVNKDINPKKIIKRKPLSDTNNNGQTEKSPTNSYLVKPLNSSKQNKSRVMTKNLNKLFRNNTSVRVLEDRRKSARIDMKKLDVYEFTFDPNEEPPPPKKKKTAKRKPNKPKMVTFKSNYDKNLAKALAALKKTVAVQSSQKRSEIQKHKLKSKEIPVQETQLETCESFSENGHHSVQMDDIALQVQHDDDNINYSPVNSPNAHVSPVQQLNCESPKSINNNPLNLKDAFSFFDEIPAACSSMNNSVKHPQASPWRVEFGSLPIRWNINAYVKPNMTPSVETSFVNFNESNKRKHVYTNIGLEDNEPLVDTEKEPVFKQTSIISFIKEVVEKKSKKKKNGIRSNVLIQNIQTNVTPVKNNSSIVTHVTPVKNNPITSDKDATTENQEKGQSVLRDHQNFEITDTGLKNSAKKKNKDITYFGFDDSENQENISPVKKTNKAKHIKSRSHAILKEINDANPARVAIPKAAKKSALNNVNKFFDEMKSATEPPVFPDVHVQGDNEGTDIHAPDVQTCVGDLDMPESRNEQDEDSQSVHLFEDIDIVHHLKLPRKSYGKTKKVAFKRNSDSSSYVEMQPQCNSSDDMDDESFRLPSVKQKKTIKKKTKKPKMSKKEKQEVEAWAAGFNSMCEDIEEYDLVVE